jgi:DNA-binding NtrC family response regulator
METNGGFVPVDLAQGKQMWPRGNSPAGEANRIALMAGHCFGHEDVEEIITDCGGNAYRVEMPVNEAPLCPRLASQILVVALEGEEHRQGALPRILPAYRQQGTKVVAIANGLDHWPLRDRCSLLLAGVSHLLDSVRPSFKHDLCRLLGEMVKVEKASEDEKKRTSEMMGRLGIVGASQAMQTVFSRLARISPLSDLPVLLTGETGTGKELLARALHTLDPKRCQGPFIPVNCATINPLLAESELFGHRRGSFTGAERDRKGLIRAANGGVLFLDEIGELGPDLQPKLLRVLQEHRVLTLGEEEEVSVSVRVVAATNQDLGASVEQRRFRADLFQRLNVLPIRVPPLRERGSDVELLARHFLDKHSGLRPEETLDADQDFFEALAEAEWTGNVRQLENVIRQAVVNKQAAVPLNLSDLPPEIWLQLCQTGIATAPGQIQDEMASRTPQPKADPSSHGDLPMWEGLLRAHDGNLTRCLQACERALLAVALKSARGNQSQMARIMGITARSVYSKLRKHGLHS